LLVVNCAKLISVVNSEIDKAANRPNTSKAVIPFSIPFYSFLFWVFWVLDCLGELSLPV